MNVLIIGSGGREHAICVSCKNSEFVSEIYCIPGNAGTERKRIFIDINNFKKSPHLLKKKKIEIVIVGPETTCIV